MVLDSDTFEEWDIGITPNNPCGFEGYIEKIEELKIKTGLDEAVVTGLLWEAWGRFSVKNLRAQ